MAKSNERVNLIFKFIESLTIPSGKGEGEPFKLRPFQKRFIQDVYGATDKAGNRRVRRAGMILLKVGLFTAQCRNHGNGSAA